MKEKVIRVLKILPYPAFYVVCLVLFGYLTFPFDRLKVRILSEIGKQSKGAKDPPVVTLEHLDSYWLTGVELSGVKVRLPADNSPAAKTGFGWAAPKAEPEKDSIIDVKEAHARARILPLLLGRVQMDFWASVFGGEVSGTTPTGTSKGDVEVKIEDCKLSEVDPLQKLLGVPIDGKVNGALSLSPVDGKFSKATGKVDFSIKNLVVSDGKTKIGGMLAIPPARVDEIVLSGEADKGVLKITKLSAAGPDLEMEGDGKVSIRESFLESSVDLYIKFRFTDAYRGKDGTTKSILGEPGSMGTPLIETTVPKLKKAKRSDGFYGFHIHGKIKKLDFTPSSTDASGSGGSSAPSRKPGKGDSPLLGGKRPGGLLPLGASTATSVGAADEKNEDKPERKEPEDRRGALPMPMPMPMPMPPAPKPDPTPEMDPIVPPPTQAQPPPQDTPPPGDNPPPGLAPPGDVPPSDQPPQPPSDEPR